MSARMPCIEKLVLGLEHNLETQYLGYH